MMRQYHIFQSWNTTRISLNQTASKLKQKRKKLWENLQSALSNTPALSEYAGCELSEYPIVTAHQIRSALKQWNSVGIEDADAHKAAENAENGGTGEILTGITAGYSTGTSGNKGIFLASQHERNIYLGQIMAKLLPGQSIFRGIRVQLFLRANSRLYSDVQKSSLFKFRYCSLSLSPQEKLDAVNEFMPTVLIAPSHVLLELARSGYKQSSLVRCFYGAEPMGEDERQWISEQIGIRPDPIYQATEGFLGFSCKNGRLHLNEDSLEFELSDIPGTSGYQIIVTDLLRRTQPIVRVKLDDYIELDDRSCSCGFAGRTIRPLLGRIQNLWRFGDQTITPRQVTRVLEQSLGASNKWEAMASQNNIKLLLERSVPNDLARQAANRLSQSLNLKCPIVIEAINENEKPSKRQRAQWSAING